MSRRNYKTSPCQRFKMSFSPRVRLLWNFRLLVQDIFINAAMIAHNYSLCHMISFSYVLLSIYRISYAHLSRLKHLQAVHGKIKFFRRTFLELVKKIKYMIKCKELWERYKSNICERIWINFQKKLDISD